MNANPSKLKKSLQKAQKWANREKIGKKFFVGNDWNLKPNLTYLWF